MDVHKKHTLDIGTIFADWLNRAKGNSAYEEVCGLLKAMQSLTPTLKSHPAIEEGEDGRSKYLADSPGAILRDSINAALAKNPVIRSLKFVSADAFSFGWYSAKSESEERKAMGKTTMIQMLCDLADTGALSSLRQCQSKDCNRWFMANRSNMLHCSVKCRRRHHATSEEFKAQRREYMRQRYKIITTKNVK